MPNNYQARKEYNYIYLEERNESNNNDYKILFDNYLEINDLIIKTINSSTEDGNNICRLNSKEISLPLYIRNKQPGDYIEVLGLNGKKKISDIFIENKIPKDNRNTYPLLVDSNNKILWIPNIKKSKYNVKKHELCDIILTSYKKGGN